MEVIIWGNELQTQESSKLIVEKWVTSEKIAEVICNLSVLSEDKWFGELSVWEVTEDVKGLIVEVLWISNDKLITIIESIKK
jgi:hypothetical protein